MCHKGETIFSIFPLAHNLLLGFFQEVVLCTLENTDGSKIHIYGFLIQGKTTEESNDKLHKMLAELWKHNRQQTGDRAESEET